MVIDGDGHCNEPRDLFDRYLEKDFRERGPRVVDAGGRRWMIEGKFLPRPVGTWGHGSSSDYFVPTWPKREWPPDAIADYIPGRLKDLDNPGIDIQVGVSDIMAMASHSTTAIRPRRAQVPQLSRKSRELRWTRQTRRRSSSAESCGGGQRASSGH